MNCISSDQQARFNLVRLMLWGSCVIKMKEHEEQKKKNIKLIINPEERKNGR